MWCYHSSIANLGLTFLNRLQFTDFSGCWVSKIVSALGPCKDIPSRCDVSVCFQGLALN